MGGEGVESLLQSQGQLDLRQRHNSLHGKNKDLNAFQHADTKEFSTLSKRKLSESSNIIDVDPPFFNIPTNEDYCIAVTGKNTHFSLVNKL